MMADEQPNMTLNILNLEQVERQQMARDRSGIIFSNILRQARGPIH